MEGDRRDWRTAKKSLTDEQGKPPKYGPRRRSPGRVIDPFTAVIDAWLRIDPLLAGDHDPRAARAVSSVRSPSPATRCWRAVRSLPPMTWTPSQAYRASLLR